MKTTNNNNTTTTTTTTVFQLSKIHRLIRPLKSSISSLETQLNQQQNRKQQQQQQQNKKKKKNSFYSEPKSNKRSLEEDLEFNHTRSNYHHHQKKYKRSNNNQQQQQQRKTTSQSKTNPISSPIFNSTPAITTTNRTFNSQDNQLIELETQIKIDKLILAYKNILDAVYPTTTTTTTSSSSSSAEHQISKLSTICARVIGRFIERAIELETNQVGKNSGNPDDDEEEQEQEQEQEQEAPISLFTELDWKTSVMDEWYDAIPLLYRRYALAQHALTMILRAFPIQEPPTSKPQAKRNGHQNGPNNGIMSYQQKIIQAIHGLHRSYTTPFIQSQALLILPSLFSLPTRTWFEIYDDYQHKFELVDRFVDRLIEVEEGRTFLEICSDREMVGFIDLTIDRLGAWAIESWLGQRESLICSRTRWRRGREARQAGLESSDSEAGMEEEAIVEYDRQSSSIVLKWINSLVVACLPSSIHCAPARRQLNAISRLLFDSLISHTSSSTIKECSKADNNFLGLLSITVESHRLTLFGLPMFNTGSVERVRREEEEEEEEDVGGEGAKWSSGHAPMRLQALIDKLGGGEERNEGKMFNKAAKLFFRGHRSTRLLAVLPGLLSCQDRAVIPGLEQLFQSVVEGSYALERLAKGWVESLLQSDPASWWRVPSDHSHPPPPAHLDDEDEDLSLQPVSVAHDVRRWLENWLGLLDNAEKVRATIDDEHEPDPSSLHLLEDHQEQEEEVEEELDIKPSPSCTCSQVPLVIPPEGEEQEEKPEIQENSNPPVGKKKQQRPGSSKVRVVVPLPNPHPPPAHPRRKKRARSARLSLPSSRRKKSRTPATSSNTLSNTTATPNTIGNKHLGSTVTPTSTNTNTNALTPAGSGGAGRKMKSQARRTGSMKSAGSNKPGRSKKPVESRTRRRRRRLEEENQEEGPDPKVQVDEQDEQDEDDDDDFDAMDLLACKPRTSSVFTTPTPSHTSTSTSTLPPH
ncbi:hypothetical protein PGT21_012590 [Puccinia graminis f. sp. tritici]|uniref:Uncharacterized protein n=1 Tax=Puccinia graminis f. sp. tritici TaxID=56615 RepID=A0A5B0MB07_PUCGR|nr:hypothetical protein PGT21_012590 [Puccinia graminis f. sp. tritici]